MLDRAVLFIDGNNWFHALKACRVEDIGRLDYAKISQKLTGARDWCGTRYYIGRVQQVGNRRLYADQRRFLAQLAANDRRITCHLGRFESRVVESQAALDLEHYLASLQIRINARVYHDLQALAQRYAKTEVLIEKMVDVMLAVLRRPPGQGRGHIHPPGPPARRRPGQRSARFGGGWGPCMWGTGLRRFVHSW